MEQTSESTFSFHHAEKGMTRFPPNVEQISVERQTGAAWLIARRNDVTLRFPLSATDCAHLASLLVGSPPKRIETPGLSATATPQHLDQPERPE